MGVSYPPLVSSPYGKMSPNVLIMVDNYMLIAVVVVQTNMGLTHWSARRIAHHFHHGDVARHVFVDR